ncbi:MAG TPA: ComF family protein [Firmicutes bacterium]|nr:ComF family protein [Bacillota bacterium]
MFKKRSIFSFCRSLGRGLLDLLYPPLLICPVCGGSFPKYYGKLRICADCLKRLPIITPPLCEVCSRPVRGDESSPCAECRREPRFYRRGKAVFLYTGMMREILHAAKYDFRPELATAIGTLLAVGVEDIPFYDKIDLIIPVPLHPAKVKSRGYNQAELIAAPVAVSLRKPLQIQTLVRNKLTRSQSKCGRAERKKNIANAFTVIDGQAVAGKKILLIDDIATTGYTLSECARMLLLAGAKEVNVLTAAIGVLEENWRT